MLSSSVAKIHRRKACHQKSLSGFPFASGGRGGAGCGQPGGGRGWAPVSVPEGRGALPTLPAAIPCVTSSQVSADRPHPPWGTQPVGRLMTKRCGWLSCSRFPCTLTTCLVWPGHPCWPRLPPGTPRGSLLCRRAGFEGSRR